MEKLLQEFKPVFTKPQHRNFSTYILGLIACEGTRNVENMNRCSTEHRDQSTLNRFLTESPWSARRLEERRLELTRRGLPVGEGSTGTLVIDDTINGKNGKKMEDAGYQYDSVEGKPVWGHDIVTTHYANGDFEYPVSLRLYVKRETCLRDGRREFKTKLQLAVDRIEAFRPPPRVETVVAFDSWYF